VCRMGRTVGIKCIASLYTRPRPRQLNFREFVAKNENMNEINTFYMLHSYQQPV
jgi:hypothetical protein